MTFWKKLFGRTETTSRVPSQPDPVEAYVAALGAGEYFVIAIERSGSAIEVAREIVFQNCPGAKYSIFPAGYVEQLPGATLADRAVLVVGELDEFQAASVRLSVGTKAGTRIYDTGRR